LTTYASSAEVSSVDDDDVALDEAAAIEGILIITATRRQNRTQIASKRDLSSERSMEFLLAMMVAVGMGAVSS
jgi:hypothetical protein